LQGSRDRVQVIAVVEQNGDLRNIDGFGAKVIKVITQQFNQALVIRHTGFGAVSKKRQAQGIDGKMAFDAIGAFVVTEPFGLDTGIARIFHSLRIDDQQSSPLWFFLTCCRTLKCKADMICSITPSERHCL